VTLFAAAARSRDNTCRRNVILRKCRNCGAAPGKLHEPFCACELCPFCGDFINTCECIVSVLGLNAEERQLVEDFEDNSVDPLRSIWDAWCAAIEAKGRIVHGG
jgi:hypothetical protein